MVCVDLDMPGASANACTSLPAHITESMTVDLAEQVTLPDWPGRLPLSLLQLVISPLEDWEDDIAAARFARRLESCGVFLRVHVPPLHSLQHLALHGLDEIGRQHLATVCTAAAALPHLISLHLVRISTLSGHSSYARYMPL